MPAESCGAGDEAKDEVRVRTIVRRSHMQISQSGRPERNERKAMKAGDIVRYAEKWSRPEERDLLFVITRAEERRCLITLINDKLPKPFPYQEMVEYEMIEYVGSIDDVEVQK